MQSFLSFFMLYVHKYFLILIFQKLIKAVKEIYFCKFIIYKKIIILTIKLNKLVNLTSRELASRGAGSQSVTVKSTVCGFDPHSRK